MKIMIIASEFLSDSCFRGLRLLEMAKTFSAQGDTEVRIVVHDPTIKIKKSRSYEKFYDNISIVRYGRKYVPRFFHILNVVNPLSSMCGMLLFIKESLDFKQDFIISVAPPFAPTISACLISIILKKPFTVDIKDNWIDNKMKDRIFSTAPRYTRFIIDFFFNLHAFIFFQSCKQASFISTVYDSMIDDLSNKIGSGIPIIHIQNGINIEELESTRNAFDKNKVLKKYDISTANKEKNIIFIGEIGDVYQPDIIIEHLKNLLKEGVYTNYILVGDGKLKNRIMDLSKDLGIANHVYLLGIKSHMEVLELLLASDIGFYVLDKEYPVQNCALGTKVLEYIACKLPILSVSSNNSNVYNFVSENGVGIALNWNETNKIEESLRELLTNSEYHKNIEGYYSKFIATFNRNDNNKRLYNKIVECVPRIKKV